MYTLRPDFWKHYRLHELNPLEWEALCDGCGLCCLVKLEDEDTGKVVYTKVACQLLDCETGKCSNYEQRHRFVPDCIQLTADTVQQMYWLPQSCAYKRLAHGRPLPTWHYLNTGSRQSVIDAKKSVAGRCISEQSIHEDDLENHVVKWVK